MIKTNFTIFIQNSKLSLAFMIKLYMKHTYIMVSVKKDRNRNSDFIWVVLGGKGNIASTHS
jgi:hypothetical protein